MDGENKSSVQDDPLLNRISESTDDSEGVATQLPSASSQRHDFLFKVNQNTGRLVILFYYYSVRNIYRYLFIQISISIATVDCNPGKQWKWENLPFEAIYR